MRYNNISIELLVKGKPITEYPHNGQVFVEGRAGSNFEIAVQNHSRERVEAIISVDGLATTDGKDAGPASPGYLLEAFERIVIPGWWLDGASVASFVFTGKGGSYAAHAGDARNTGVIGVLVYAEQVKRYDYTSHPITREVTWGATSLRQYLGEASYGECWNASSMSANGFDATMPTGAELTSQSKSYRMAHASYASMSPAAIAENQRMWEEKNASVNNIGTGFGQAQKFSTTSVAFERGDMLSLMTLFYDDARGLRARGIDLSRRNRRKDNEQPNAFPGMSGGCVPPPGWRP